MEAFADCYHCGSGIYPGQQCYSVTFSLDYIESIHVVQPLEAESITIWCSDCAPEAIHKVKRHLK